MSNQKQLLRVGRQTQVGRGFAFRQLIDPFDKVTDACSTRQGKTVVILNTRNDLVLVLESSWSKKAGHQALKLLKIGVVIDLATVGLGHESADHVPGQLLRSHVGSALSDGVNPVVDDVGGAFVL